MSEHVVMTPALKSRITQEMIDLYDRFTHVTFDRREFMDRLAKLAGSAALAQAILPMLTANAAKAAIVDENDPRVAAETVSIPGMSDTVSGYLVKPADAAGPLPGVVVIHENRGLTPHIRDVARRVALEGYVALAPDLLSVAGGTPDDEDRARELIGALDYDKAIGDAVATAALLRGHPATTGKVGATGFCWGGGMTNRLAVSDPDLNAAVPYYGPQPPSEMVQHIEAPLLIHYAGEDERINKGIAAYESALKAAGKTYTIHIYEGVQHAFNNDTSEARYDKAAADLAWQRTFDFFARYLKG